MTSHSKDAIESWFDETTFTVLDRSDLELWAECPAQAWLVANGKCVRESKPMLVGQESHDVLSATLKSYLSAPHEFVPFDVREMLVNNMMGSRPDVQPEVIRNLERVVYDFARLIVQDVHHENILRYDGGEGERSGQLAIDLTHLGVRATSEIDLLFSGPSPDVLHEIDYKTGHTPHTAQSVADSFQFQMHAALILSTYEDVQAVEICVWRTLANQKTYRVMFERKDLGRWLGRIGSAAMLHQMYASHPVVDKIVAWPESDKCSLCPVSHCCPVLECHPAEPAELLEKLVVVENAEAELRKKLIAAVKRTGHDVVTRNGDRFSRVGPKSEGTWKVTAKKADVATAAEE